MYTTHLQSFFNFKRKQNTISLHDNKLLRYKEIRNNKPLFFKNLLWRNFKELSIIQF